MPGYKRLQDGPQTGIQISHLDLEERIQTRKISVTGARGNSGNFSGKLITVYYLQGDEQEAIKRFVEFNREALGQIDFAERNAIQSALELPFYDAVLEEVGYAQVRRYRNTVVERRENGETWIVDRDYFEQAKRRQDRYRIGKTHAARIESEISLTEVYEAMPELFARHDLADWVDGHPPVLMQYYLDCLQYDCLGCLTGYPEKIRKYA
jgi:hypothetical protein